MKVANRSEMNMELPDFAWLNEFLDAQEKAIGAMDLSTLQPTSWLHFQPLIAKEWLDWFEKIIDERERQKIQFSEMAKAIQPGLCHDHLYFTQLDLKAARWPREKRLKTSDFFYQTIRAGAQGDYFGLRGSNLEHSPEQVKQILKRDFEEGTPEAARELGKLHNAAYNLAASLYLNFYMGKGMQNCGPYELGGGRQLAVREMQYLRPLEIWPETTAAANEVDLFAIYEGTKFSVDLITCHTQFNGNAISGLKNWRLEKDGGQVSDLQEIRQITQNLGQNCKSQWLKIKSMGEKELIEKALWIRCFVFKDACDLLGLDWKPTKEMLAALVGKTLEQGWNLWHPPAQEKAAIEYWRKINDPRIDFYP